MTLITCTYNRINHLKKLVISLKNQSLLPDEFIVSDDGSKDDIELFLKKEFQDEKRFKVKFLKQDDLGFRSSRARNNGVRESEGQLLVIVDSDIVMPKRFLEIFYKNRKNNQMNLSRPLRLTKENNEDLKDLDIINNTYEHLYSKKSYAYNIERYYKNKLYKVFAPKKQAEKFRTMAFSIYKDDYIKLNGFDENFIGWGAEDIDFGRRAYYKGIKINNSHRNNFQIHQWHEESDKNNDNSLKYFKKIWDVREQSKNYEIEFGYSKTFGKDKYKVVEIC
ncbi:MAG: glycosyltransferase [Fusobacteriaceae bacterium]